MPSPTMTLISSVTVGSSGASSIDFTSIPSTYTDLCLELSIRTTDSQTIGPATLQINGDTTNYSSKELVGSGSSVSSTFRNAVASALYLGNGVGNTATANTFGNMSIYIPNYANITTYKSISIDNVGENNSSTAYATLLAGLWSSNSAINRLTVIGLSTNLVQYSTAYLYGISKS